MVSILFNQVTNLFLIENQKLESIWIIIPSLILVKIGVPSLYLLYITDDSVESSVSLKVNAQQWFWRYEYSDFWTSELQSSLEFDSYIVPESELELGMTRLLETNMRPILPYLVQTRVLITRLDVLHCWTVPSLGVKVDAAPGRINQVKFFTYQPGVFYGQCSEICGANHSFIPIALEFLRPERFLNWVDVNRQ
jgi:cytochrome c oxidase subunit 2